MAFFDFPAQHWQSIRTSNPIESAFATSVIAPSDQRAA
jgi:transposase-like protein